MARVPASVFTKLITAFMVIVILLIMLGAVSLQVLMESNRRTEEVINLYKKTAAFRQLQHDTTSQLYSVSTALLSPSSPSA